MFILMLVILSYSFIRLNKSPVFLLPTFYMSVCCYTYIGTEFLDFAKEVPFNFYDFISKEYLYRSYGIFILAASAFITGTLLIKDNRTYSRANQPTSSYNRRNRNNIYIIFLYLFLIVLLHLGNGFGNLYYREGYTLDGAGLSSARILYTMILPLLCLCLPFYKGSSTKFILILLLYLLVLGTSSRNLIMIPACYFVGSYIRYRKINFISVVFSLLAVMFSVALVMETRNNIIQGVIPNINYLFDNGIDLTFIGLAINYLTSFSVFATALTIQDHSFDSISFITSLNPLPSSYLNIEYMVQVQKLNENAPFPALGTLALSGNIAIFIYYFLSGMIWKFLYNYFEKKWYPMSIFISMLFILFTILSTQYNLRGATRLLYYLVFLGATIKFMFILRYNLNLMLLSSSKNSH
ncbi:O-antigen polysaccharide polymerase Wzy [Paraglaciecola agarilytica]|uniref:O-antigen polysaccharide polymerase Wzy n=1 Tax=Paraglaciecola chathamensis TaxID=368405 RepID=UPI001C07F828|nr:O-antigen polysaccharide polymerase Wzy [Paraglaciecola agarilytica]MBU3016150.1 O-antigen polysaccharide polymerase Wzy [Paraglaciecola agarilytica]